MPYAEYTRQVLAEAVSASTSMAGALRLLGIRLNGGAHAPFAGAFDRLGITSH